MRLLERAQALIKTEQEERERRMARHKPKGTDDYLYRSAYHYFNMSKNRMPTQVSVKHSLSKGYLAKCIVTRIIR